MFLLLYGALAGFPACLPDDPPVKGRLLFPGVAIEHPEFLKIEEETWVMFDIRKRPRVENGPGGVLEVNLVKWNDPSQHRVVVPRRAERPEWPRLPDGVGSYFYMVDERLPDQGPRQAVGTLQRIRLDGTVVESIDDVMTYGWLGGGRFFYRKHRPDARQPELHLRDLSGRDRNLGVLSGQVHFQSNDRVYYVSGDDQTWTRVDGFTGEPVKLRTRVSRFQLHPSERFAIISVTDEGKPRTVVIDLATRAEKPLPIENPSHWLELRGEVFIFSDAAREGRPAELHFFNTATGEDRRFVLPEGVPTASAVVYRPTEYRDGISFDSLGGITVFRPERPEAPFERTGLRPAAPSFMLDGRHLIFIEPEPPPPPPAVSNYPTGKLFAQPTDDWQAPPRQLSPRGASVPLSPVGYRQRPDAGPFPLLFWARFGLGGSDLYLSNPDTGDYLKVAEGIGAVQVGDRHVLGVVRLSQDLTGDLVVRDFVEGREQMVETGVSDMGLGWDPVMGDVVAFVVRERRVESKRNGLWGAALVPAADPPPEMTAPARRRVPGARSLFGGPERLTTVRPE